MFKSRGFVELEFGILQILTFPPSALITRELPLLEKVRHESARLVTGMIMLSHTFENNTNQTLHASCTMRTKQNLCGKKDS